MDELVTDLRYTFRALRKSPGFTIVVILTLALGIGANTAIFSIVNGVLLRPLPYENPDQLVSVYWKTQEEPEVSFSYPDFLDCQRQTRAFSAMAAYLYENYTLLGNGDPEWLNAERVSADFFPMLNVKPLLGRTIRRDEDKIGGTPIVVIGDHLWKRKFNSSPDVLGTAINLSGTMRTVVGVVPSQPPFFDPLVVDVYVPIGQWDDASFRNRSVHMGTNVLARLKPGVTISQGRADVDSVAHSLASAEPASDKNAAMTVVSLKEDTVGSVRGILLILLGAVEFVLLIACANVANLLLARYSARSSEFAIRSALGASNFRLVRQVLTESVLLGLAGGALGLASAALGTKAILQILPSILPRTPEIRINVPVLAFTLAASVFTGIVFGLLPAVRFLRPDLSERLKNAARGSTTGRSDRVRSVLVVVEFALSIVLLTGAGLMVRTLGAIWKTDPGFKSQGVLTFDLAFSKDRLTSPSMTRQNISSATAAIEAVPGIEAASGVAGSLPTSGASTMTFWIEGNPKPGSESEMNVATWYAVQSDYLKTMGIPLLRGRFISTQDTEHTPSVVVIDEMFALRYFPNENPIGKHINTTLMGPLSSEIIGVVGHTKQFGLGEIESKQRQPQFYHALEQIPDQTTPLLTGIGMVARTEGSPDKYVGAVRTASKAFNASQVAYQFKAMDQIVAESVANQRFTMILLGLFAATALLLSTVGVYGVISYLAGQRTREVGVRMALGAQASDVLQLIIGRGAKLGLAGIAIGLPSALVLAKLLSQFLFGVSAADPVTIISVVVIVSAAGLAACYIPARRAVRIDPMTALKYE
jgi:predicted permease